MTESSITMVVLNSRGDEITNRLPVKANYTEDPEPTVRLSDAWIPLPLNDPAEIALYSTEGEILARVPIQLNAADAEPQRIRG